MTAWTDGRCSNCGAMLTTDGCPFCVRKTLIVTTTGHTEYADPRAAEIARLKAEVAEQTARAERAEAEAEVRSGRWCEKNRNEGRGGCGMCGWCCKQSREDRDLAIIDAARRTTERDTALAACAEMRAALEAVATANTRRLGESRRAIEAARALLSRPDLGHGWASPEDTAQMVGALQMVESDVEFDSLHEVTRKFVVDVLALLKAEVETAKAWQGAAVLRNYDAVRILTEEIGAPGPENIDETARRAVMVIRAHKRALAAGPADLRWRGPMSGGEAAKNVEAAQAAAMKDDGKKGGG